MKYTNPKKVIILLVVVGSVAVLSGCIGEKEQPPAPQTPIKEEDASFSIEDITDRYPSYLPVPNGFYDAYCARGCSSGDPISRQRTYGFNDVADEQKHHVYVFFVTASKIDSFKLTATTGVPEGYVVREQRKTVWGLSPTIVDRPKYVYKVVVEYTPKIKNGSEDMFLIVKGLVDDSGVSTPYTIHIRKDQKAKRGHEYFYN